MLKSKLEPSRGVLHRQESAKHFQISRYQPSSAIAFFVEHYWIVRWDLRGKNPYRQDVLTHPSVHLVFEKRNTWIWGVVTGKFTRELKEKGQVLGIKFLPGAFYAFLQKPVATFTDDLLPFNEVFDDDLEVLEDTILSYESDEHMVNKAEAFLMRHLPEKDPRIEEINQIIQCIMNEKTILKVDDLVKRFSYNKRTLQRLFRQYVGVTPKWVISRYRLHEAAEQMAAGQTENWPTLALELGYFDQAHFIRDFKAIVGQSPAEYTRSISTKNHSPHE